MGDDFLERLRVYRPMTCSACDTWGVCGYGEPCDCSCHSSPCSEAADEIERLITAGDELYDLVRRYLPHDGWTANDRAKAGMILDRWEEARRG